MAEDMKKTLLSVCTSVFALVSGHLDVCQIFKVAFSESKPELEQKP